MFDDIAVCLSASVFLWMNKRVHYSVNDYATDEIE